VSLLTNAATVYSYGDSICPSVCYMPVLQLYS